MPQASKSTPQERKALAAQERLAKQIAKLRDAGTPWDGERGIVAQGLVKGAPQGRALLRKFGLDGNRIAKSYERTPEFKAAESARRKPQAAPAKPRRKRTAK